MTLCCGPSATSAIGRLLHTKRCFAFDRTTVLAFAGLIVTPLPHDLHHDATVLCARPFSTPHVKATSGPCSSNSLWQASFRLPAL